MCTSRWFKQLSKEIFCGTLSSCTYLIEFIPSSIFILTLVMRSEVVFFIRSELGIPNYYFGFSIMQNHIVVKSKTLGIHVTCYSLPDYLALNIFIPKNFV